MSEILYLNSQKVDISPEPITRKIQIGDIGEVESWKSSFSYTIKLPKTSRNKQVVDMLGTIGNQSRKPFELISCDYVVQGFYIVRNGFAVIRETGNYFNLNIIDGIKSLSNILGTKKLTDLDLSSLNHNLNVTTFTDSFSNTSGYIYGLAHFGKPNPIDVTSTFNTTTFVIDTIVGSHSVPLEVETNSTGSGGQDVQDLTDLATELGAFYKVEVDSIELDINVDYEVSYDVNVNGLTLEVRLKQFRNDSLHNNRLLDSASGNNGDTISFDFDITENYTDVQIGDYFILTVTGNLESFESQIPYLADVTVTGEAYSKVEKFVPSIYLHTLVSEILSQNNITAEGDFFSTNLDYLNEVITLSEGFTISSVGQLIQPGNYLDEINQIDLIKDLSNRYGLVLVPNDEKYTFINLEEILNDRANAEDWTNKLAGISSEKYNSGYAKSNTAKFSYNENATSGSADGDLIIDNENANTEKSLFSSIFEIPDQYSTLSSYPFYNIPVWEMDGSTVKNSDTPIKVMSIRKEDFSITFKMLTNATTITETTDIPLLSLQNISLQDSIDTYYAKLQDVIDNYQMIECLVNLSVIDIYNLDFTKLKYLKQTGQYYYLNSVQYTAGKLSKVNLLKV